MLTWWWISHDRGSLDLSPLFGSQTVHVSHPWASLLQFPCGRCYLRDGAWGCLHEKKAELLYSFSTGGISANGFSSREWSERSPGLPLQPAVGSAPLLSPNCTCRRKAWKSTMMICVSWTRLGKATLAVWKAQPCALALLNQAIGNDFGFTVTSGSSGLHIVWSLCNDLTLGWRLKKNNNYFYLTFQISRFSTRTFPLLEVC